MGESVRGEMGGGAGFGMFYRVERSFNGGAYTLLDVVGSPGAGKRSIRFTDESVPVGTRLVEYKVIPMRGEARGRSGPSASVQFGGVQEKALREHRRVAA